MASGRCPILRVVPPSQLRLAESLAALSLVGDLGMGFALEHAVRVTYLAGRLAAKLGLGADERSNVFYVGLLHGIGCTADAHDLARVYRANEIALKTAGAVLDDDDPIAGLRFTITHAGSSGPAIVRPVAFVRALALGEAAFRDGLRAHCEVGDLLASAVGVPAVARDGLLALFDRWDGKGIRRLGGTDLPLAARVFHVAKTATAHFDRAGAEAAVAAVRAQAGRALEPALADAFLDVAAQEPVLAALTEPDLWDRTLALEPADRRLEFDAASHAAMFEAIADMADLKSPAFHGHSRRVSALAVAAGRQLGLPVPDLEVLGRAALAHDLGRVSIPNTILDKPRALASAEWEVVAVSTRITRSAPCCALRHWRRMRPQRACITNGSTAPDTTVAYAHLPSRRRHGCSPRPNSYQALTSARSYRPALEPQRAASALREDAAAGRLDGGAVEAVIATASGQPVRLMGGRRLSEREVEVLGLLASGFSTREVAARLTITEKTVRHHVEHIYDKLGVSTRAAAVVAALHEGRLGDRLVDPKATDS